jgi:ComF family protein
MASSARVALARLDGLDTVLIPVPLSAARLRERGFNQADELATALAGHLGIVRVSPITRAPGRGRQAGAGRTARRHNVQGRFVCGRSRAGKGRDALLIDDVVTTGSTLIECASVLRETGFGRIGALTFARTLRRPPGSPGNRKRDDRGTV